MKIKHETFSAEYLRSIIHYDPEGAPPTWLVSKGANAAAGRIAGGRNGRGYWCIMIDGHTYKLSRLAWLYMTSEWPRDEIDHINRDPTDDRFCNLREATNRQNQANKLMRRDGGSGFKCVSRHAPKGSRVKWQAYIGLNRKRHSLGYFDTPGSAALASTIAAEKHFGEFSRPTLEDTCVSIFMDAWRDARWKFDWVRV